MSAVEPNSEKGQDGGTVRAGTSRRAPHEEGCGILDEALKRTRGRHAGPSYVNFIWHFIRPGSWICGLSPPCHFRRLR